MEEVRLSLVVELFEVEGEVEVDVELLVGFLWWICVEGWRR